MEFLSVRQYAAAHAVSQSSVRYWLKNGRLPGAQKVGAMWVIPVLAGPCVKPVGRPKEPPQRPYREFEEHLLKICAGVPDTTTWRSSGPSRLMAGLAILMASDTAFDRPRYLELARSLDPSMMSAESVRAWLAESPVKPSRFMPMLKEYIRGVELLSGRKSSLEPGNSPKDNSPKDDSPRISSGPIRDPA